MRAKSRWTLLFLGLSAGAAPLTVHAEPSILESLGLPPVFKPSEPGNSSVPRAKATNNSAQRPGSISAPARQAMKPVGSSNGEANALFPSLKNFGEILGLESTPGSKPIGQSAEGIAAPPMPTLEATEPKNSDSRSAVPKIGPARPAEAKPANKTFSPPVSSKPIRVEGVAKTPPAIETRQAALAVAKKTPAVIVKKTTTKSATESSRRGWQGNQTGSYIGLEDGSSGAEDEAASLEMTELIDRRVSVEEEIPELDEQTSRPRQPAFDSNNPPQPLVFGQPAPLTQERVSIADRMAEASEAELPSYLRKAPSGDVAPASYLPPIISAEDARRMKAARNQE